VQSLQIAPSITTAAALSITSVTQTVISGAITTAAVQNSGLDLLPRNCTLGTAYFCLGYVDNVTCSRLPLGISDLLSRALPASSSYQLSNLESLDQELEDFSSGTIEGPFIAGIILTFILIIALQYAFWKGGSICAGEHLGLPLEAVLGGLGISVCVLSFICPIVVLWVLYFEIERLQFDVITVEKGKLWSNSITLLCCAVVMSFCAISMFVRKYILLLRA
jgi:hypothetical protein